MNEEIKIKFDDKGFIIDAFHSEIKIDGNYIVVASDIWEQYSKYNKDDLQIKDNEIVILNDADKKINIIKIKAKANELINSKYPSYKQLNIIRNGGKELEIMALEIDRIRAISNEAEIEGTALKDIDWGVLR